MHYNHMLFLKAILKGDSDCFYKEGEYLANKKQVSNTKEKVPSSIEMNDMDYFNVVLTIEKNMSNNYSIALNEACNDYLFEDYFNLFGDTKDMGVSIRKSRR